MKGEVMKENPMHMKVVIYATSGSDLMKHYPLIEQYKGYYNNADDDYWRDNCIIKRMGNDELVKVMNTLTSYTNLVIGYASKSDHELYDIDFFIEIYDDLRE
jgi:hypothetical protein